MSEIKKEKYELYFEMENRYKLFELKTEDGFPIWDVVRLHVWLDILFSSYYKSQKQIKPSISTRLKRFLFSLKSILSFSKLLFLQAESFHYGHSRIKNNKGEYYDPYFDAIKNLIPGSFIFFEVGLYQTKYTNDNRVFDIIPLYKRVLSIFPWYTKKNKKLNGKHIPYILSALHQSFENSSIEYSHLENILNDFRTEFHFYKWLLNFKKIKRIFILNNGVKSIFHAAKVNKIPSFEFQHGDIVNSSIVYNYGYVENNINGNIISPDVLLTFSNIWTTDKYIPSKCIEIGTDYFNHKIIKSNQTNSITIISSKEHNSYLEKLVFDLSSNDNTIRFYYKLHPGQFPLLEEQKAYFKHLPNVEVISIEKNMTDMMSMSNEFIAIYSTALFEVLQAGKIVYIYKQLNYRSFKSYFHLNGVHLFDNAKDLEELRKKARKAYVETEIPQFFKPFNATALSKAIENQ